MVKCVVLVELHVHDDASTGEMMSRLSAVVGELKTAFEKLDNVHRVMLATDGAAQELLDVVYAQPTVEAPVVIRKCEERDNPVGTRYEFVHFVGQDAVDYHRFYTWVAENTDGSFTMENVPDGFVCGVSVDPSDATVITFWPGGSSRVLPGDYIVRLDDKHFRGFSPREFHQNFVIIDAEMPAPRGNDD